MAKEYIRNCSWGYSCDQKWEGLSLTKATSNIRFCETCQREVHRCETTDVLAENIALNRCVNFSSELLDDSGSGCETPSNTRLQGYVAPTKTGGFGGFAPKPKAPIQTSGFAPSPIKKGNSPTPLEPPIDFDDDIPF